MASELGSGGFVERRANSGEFKRVTEGRSNQGSGAFKEYAAPNGWTLRVMNPSVRKEANRRAASTIAAGSKSDKRR